MRLRDCLLLPRTVWRSCASLRHAKKAGLPGLAFDRFGRRLGLKLISKGVREGLPYLLNPVSSFRYFEFDFVASAVPDAGALRCFDASSPRLFSIWLASTKKTAEVTVINPDGADIGTTARIVEALALGNVATVRAGIETLASQERRFDFVYSISVVEHVGGSLVDADAVRLLWNTLKPGGTLAITFPVDRRYREEYRDRRDYETQAMVGGKYFFQRHYDLQSIRDRILDPAGLRECEMRFYGERRPGIFAAYEERWLREGLHVTVEDPRIMANNFSEYANWAEMPGCGVCGLRATKPR